MSTERRRANQRAQMAELAAKRSAANLCVRCEARLDDQDPSPYCRDCRNDRAAEARGRYEMRRAQGVCVRCAAPSDGKAWCPSCAALQNAGRLKRKKR